MNFAEWKTLPMETVISINIWMGTFAEVFKNNQKQSKNDDTVISFLFSSRKEISIRINRIHVGDDFCIQ